MSLDKVSKFSIVSAYAVVYFVWGSTYFFIEKALHWFPPFVLGSIRFIIAGSVLMTYCYLKGYKLFNKRDVERAVLIGFLLLFVDMAAVIWAEQYISSAIVSILGAAAAIWFVLLDKPKWKANFGSIPIVLGLILGFGGVVMLFGEQLMNSESESGGYNVIAMLVMIFGTIAWTVGSLYTKYTQDKKPAADERKIKPLNVMVKTAWQMVTAGVAFTLSALITGEYATFSFASVPLEGWGSIAYLITMGSILAFSCYIWLLQVRPATEVSTYAYVNPVVALFLAHFFTQHKVTALQILGLTVILVSVLLMNWNLYKDNRTFRVIRARKKLKRFKYMAPKSSIPRIVEVADFNEREKQKQNKS